jgi:alkanesulfonate monooxygenase SsuD/methylene tetrahydromethanopterin reductase-like flavin-dependent oxidoreductase (luciferase family)
LGFPIRLGVSVRGTEPGPREAADFEDRGFDLVVVPDHLFGLLDPQAPFFDAWVRLAAITQATQRVRIGPLVTNLSWRNPVLVAKHAIALDRLSGGRLELGVGCGATADQSMIGTGEMPAHERVSRLDEGLDVLDRLLRGETLPFDGQFTRYDRAEVAPGCAQEPRPPLLVAAGGRRTMSVAARRADIWNCATDGGDLDSSLPAIAGRVRLLDAVCTEEGRDPSTLRRSLLIWPVGIDPWANDHALIDLVEMFVPLGFSDFVVLSPSHDRRDVLDHVTNEVIPVLHRERTALP